MREVAAIVGDRELRLMVELALNLHEFQYNGLYRDAEVSRYASEEMVKERHRRSGGLHQKSGV